MLGGGLGGEEMGFFERELEKMGFGGGEEGDGGLGVGEEQGWQGPVEGF